MEEIVIFVWIVLYVLMVAFLWLLIPYIILRRLYYLLIDPIFVKSKYKLTPSQATFLYMNYKFYAALEDKLKKKFETNVAYLINNKKFIGRLGLNITDEHKLWISAAATQVGFGHYPIRYDFFDKVLVYPSTYYSPMTKKEHVGEANEFGFIALSWDAFKEGFKYDDGRNVGLHEFAHALRIEDRTLNDSEYNFLNSYLTDELINYFENQKEAHDHKGESFFRDYAFTNFEEYFAVAVEYFFENPGEMYRKENTTYLHLRSILRLDPMNKSNPVI
jgi:Mlc titration factor MtfA (ptsG expression regulator)